MKKIVNFLSIISIFIFITACEKESAPPAPEFSIEGYWTVEGDNNFSSVAANSTADLYHLFKGDFNFYRYSFPKTQDFTKLDAKPRADSLRAVYRIEGKNLILPNPLPSVSNNVPKSVLISNSADELVFKQDVILRRSLVDGRVLLSRVDNVKYKRVTDPAKITYFDAYLKRFHP
jgi:hypothetical protein